MNLLVLMAGPSEKFQEAGHAFPKNLVEIGNRPVIEHVIGNLQPLLGPGDRMIAVLRRDENVRYHTDRVAQLLCPAVIICEVPSATAGAACSALLAVDYIDNDDPLIITNGDQLILADLRAALADFRERKLDGGVVVFEGVHPRWSFVRCNAEGLVVEAAEKRPISNLATAGFYYFARGRDFVRAAEQMILKDAQVEGAFYVCPSYNELLLDNARIGIHQIPRAAYVSLATPQAAAAYSEQIKTRPS
jgi:dTDP-glucose pyrophosphorylase